MSPRKLLLDLCSFLISVCLGLGLYFFHFVPRAIFFFSTLGTPVSHIEFPTKDGEHPGWFVWDQPRRSTPCVGSWQHWPLL